MGKIKHYGDITKILGNQAEPVDIITGGSPCQDLSVAGKRAGLAGERSGLFMEQIRIIKEMRDHDRANERTDEHIRPRYMVWENVPGAFSSNKGEDFRAVLEETAKVAERNACIPRFEGGRWPSAGCIMGDGWSIAWRVHDAQFWGVPQRRKRIALVADFGGESAPEILFERKGLSGDSAESREEGQEIAGDVGEGAEESSGAIAFEPGAMSRVGGHVYDDEKAGTVRANAGDNQQAVVYGIGSYDSNAMKSDNPHSGIYEADTSRTLDLNGGNPGCNQGGMAVVCIEGNGQRESHKGDGYKESDTMYTLNTVEQHAVCIENHPADSRVKISENGICQTLSGRMGTGGGNVPMVVETYQKTTESLCASGYDKLGTQEAANDMFVVQSAMAMQAIGEYKESEQASSLKQRDYKDATDLVVSMASKQISQNIGEDVGMTLCGNDYKEPQVVAYGLDRAAYNQGQNAQYDFAVDEEKIGTQVAKGPGAVCSAVDCRNGVEDADKNGSLQSRSSNNINSNNVCRVGSVVRRLTPLECTRLQGFPDGWVDIGDWVDSNGKLHKDADSPKYKALGNSIALPFWQWMAARMVKYIDHEPTMASLFDGIGGFPLVFSHVGCKPVWASEIEEFPIAVTKKRFTCKEAVNE